MASHQLPLRFNLPKNMLQLAGTMLFKELDYIPKKLSEIYFLL